MRHTGQCRAVHLDHELCDHNHREHLYDDAHDYFDDGVTSAKPRAHTRTRTPSPSRTNLSLRVAWHGDDWRSHRPDDQGGGPRSVQG